MQDLWVFGYGSLMWRPGFEHEEKHPALLRGYHADLLRLQPCSSRDAREARPRLRARCRGACRGVAFRVAAARADETRRYLQAREQVTLVYKDVVKTVELAGGGKVAALCSVVDRAHGQYAGRLPFEEQVRLIAEGEGRSGKNPDYLEARCAISTSSWRARRAARSHPGTP